MLICGLCDINSTTSLEVLSADFMSLSEQVIETSHKATVRCKNKKLNVFDSRKPTRLVYNWKRLILQ